jgi:shikimate kinase
MPASGKTVLGKLLAQCLDYTWIDTDQAIESITGQSVSEIFQQKGETFFRQTEAAMLKKLLLQYPHKLVLSTGGGLPAIPGVLDSLLASGLVVYLELDAKTWMNRIWGSEKMHKSPRYGGLNKTELEHFFAREIKKRVPYYMQAHYVLRVSETETPEDALKRLGDLVTQKNVP